MLRLPLRQGRGLTTKKLIFSKAAEEVEDPSRGGVAEGGDDPLPRGVATTGGGGGGGGDSLPPLGNDYD